jgi:hypothetical protein
MAECVFYGVLPVRKVGYWRHLKVNLAYAWRIARGTA